jgi:hypothetical protein
MRMGKGWTTRIWENLGWHYAVCSDNTDGIGKGTCAISPSSHSTKYRCILDGWYLEWDTTPEKAYKKAKKQLTAERDRLNQLLDRLP